MSNADALETPETLRRAGWAAYFAGELRSARPYGSDRARFWMLGWDQAAEGDSGRAGFRALRAAVEDGRTFAWALDLYRERWPAAA